MTLLKNIASSVKSGLASIGDELRFAKTQLEFREYLAPSVYRTPQG